MLPPVSSRTTSVSGETITKLVRQNYKPQALPPYHHEIIQCRTNVTCQTRKSEDYWNRNFGRRQSNRHRGFYSTLTEPYKPIGGDVILDPYELVFSSVPSSNIEPKARFHCRRGALITLEAESKIQTKKEEKSESLTLSGLGLHECCRSAGYDDIRRLLQESRQRIISVKAGMPYEDHVKAVEDQNKESLDVDKPQTDSGMVLRSVSSICMPRNPRKTQPSARHDSGRSEMISMEKTVQDLSRSPTSSNGFLRPQSRGLKSLIDVSSGITAILQRKERQFRDHLLYLQSVYSILTALHNMKLKDVKSKIPLSKEVVERLQKEGPCLPCKDEDRGSKATYNVPKAGPRQVDVDNESIMGDAGGTRMSMFSANRRGNSLDLNSKSSGRRRSRVVQTIVAESKGLETWEDFLNVQPEDYKDPTGNLLFQIGVITKFLRWRASVHHSQTLNHPGPQTAEHPAFQEMLEHQATERDHGKIEVKPSQVTMHPGPAHNTEKKKLPIWQQVAQEKSTIFQNKGEKTLNPDTTILRFKKNMNKLRKNLEKENTAEIEKMVRERVANFRLKFSTLNSEECSCIFEEQLQRIQEVKDNVNKTHLENFDVLPSKWYEELREWTMMLVSSFDQPRLLEAMAKLQTYAHMDNKTVPFAKAKLCLLMMSLPAYDICQIHMQRALKMIFEDILLGQEAQFDEWLALRKIPYVVMSPEQQESPQSRVVSPFKDQ